MEKNRRDPITGEWDDPLGDYADDPRTNPIGDGDTPADPIGYAGDSVRSEPPADCTDETGNDSVGYRRPPKHRFPKGKSGNPIGRLQEKRDLHDVFKEILYKQIPTTNGRLISGQDLVVHQIIDSATKGDPRAFRQFIQLARRAELFNDLSGRAKRISSDNPKKDILDEIEGLRRKLEEFE